MIELNPGCKRLEPDERIRRLVPSKLAVESYRDETGLIRHVIILPMSYVDVETDSAAAMSDEDLQERILTPALSMLARNAKWRCTGK